MKKIIACAAALALVGGCGSKTETVTVPDGKGGTATIKGDGEKAVITNAEGKTTSFDSTKADFPDFAPQYPGSKVVTQATMSSDGSKVATIELNTADTPAAVGEFYKKSLGAKGMEPSVMTVDNSVMVNAGGKELPSAIIVAAPADEGSGTKVSLILSTKQ